MSYRKVFLPVVAALFFGALVGWYGKGVTEGNVVAASRGGLLRQSNTPYKFISPLLACDIGAESAFPEFAPLHAQLQSLVDQLEKSGKATHLSIYMRTLNTGRFMEINDTQTYAPASLLKVFVMMAYYKEADETDNPALLNKAVVFEGPSQQSQETPGEVIPHLAAGHPYTIAEIIRQMIVYSDNDALNTLVDNFDSKTFTYFGLIFSDLGIPSPTSQKEEAFNYMAVDRYAMVFRVLFSSTYLSERYSEEALTLLSEAHYRSGMVAGTPATLTVAHKFGDTSVSPTEHELHDCGIVYYPSHPYLLCIMTDGSQFADLQQDIQLISKSTYTWLDAYYKTLPATPAPSPSK